MELKKTEAKCAGIKLTLEENGKIVARAFLFLMTNDLHENPFGLLEDVFVDEVFRGKGYGTKIVEAVISEAKARGCYKLLATSRYERPKVHDLYLRLGFQDRGKEFRLDL